MNSITAHPMKAKELDSLAEAVGRENQRLQAYRSRGGGSVQVDLERNVEGLDWFLIAEKVSDVSKVKYTADECRIRWLGDGHPQINHDDWTASEVKNLGVLVSTYIDKFGKVDWVDVAAKLGTNRTPVDCMRQGLPRQRHVWTAETDKKLLNAVQLFGIDNWNLVARHVSEHATGVQCQTRYRKSLDPSIKRGAWTQAEDERLRKAVAAYGNAWMKVAEAMPGRTNDQCHERWTEKLNLSSTAMSWTEDEDRVLLESVKTMGNQWKVISVKIGNGKTGSNCRLRHDKLKKLAAKEKALLERPEAGPSTSHTLPDMESSCSTANAIPTPDADSTAAVAPKPKQRVAGKGKGKAVVQTSILAVPDNSYEASVTPTGASEMPAAILKKGRKRTAVNGIDQPAAPTKKKRKIENLAPAEGGTLIASRPEEPGSSQVSTTTTKRPRPRPIKKGKGNQGGLTDPSPNTNMLQDSPQESSVDDRSTPMIVDVAKSTNANPTTAPIVAEVGTKLTAKSRGRARKTVPDVAAPEDPALPKKANKRVANALTLGSRRSSRLASQVTEAASSSSIQLATTSEPIEANSTTGQPTTVQPAAGDIALPHANQGDM
ncbi:hypothetical protein K443DRAFT_672566 [Laccaria amethystina LaAM-08-1]|uniref:Uncharacterized protein n=1 Tax=Laccaria amethystina LaAM-08-1 TaxID=1095629 RepID=A0A0C9XUC0_9AGAR|nr:hypothetical protein K443DRAFT_672566 [Laccaria amethystina LaAM-08-1]